MASLGQVFKGTLGGALAGGGALGVPGAIVGGLVGGAMSLFDRSPEQIARERYDAYMRDATNMLDSIGRARTRALGEATRRFSRMGSGLLRQASAGAAERAYSIGAPAKVESGVIAATAPVAHDISMGLSDTLTDIGRQYDSQEQQVRMGMLGFSGEFAGRPSMPQVGDYWLSAGPEVLAYFKDKEYISALREATQKAKKESETT